MMIKAFIDALPALSSSASAAQLDPVGKALAALAASLDTSQYRAAAGNEELVYCLHEAAGAPSLYLVSDAAGVRSPPHEHQTWAVIAGIAGSERNVLYEVTDGAAREVQPVSATTVGAGEYICLTAPAIHATLAAHGQPSYHLHLYGRPLSELPSFSSRCYQASPTRD